MTAALAVPAAPQLLLPSFEPKHWLWVDFETYYDADYQLKKMTNASYIRDPRFETIGVGVDDGEECHWFEPEEFAEWAKTVPWHETVWGSHHTQFDALIASHHYNIHPAFLVCTMSMARSYDIEGGVSLANLGKHFQLGDKGHEVEQAIGKRRKDFTREEWLRYGDYCKQDVKLCKGIFDKMLSGDEHEQPFPESELWVVDATIRSFTEPKLFIDEPLLREYLEEEKVKKASLLARIEKDRSLVMSNDKFAAELRALGVEPQMKRSKPRKDGSIEDIYAFAKSDIFMQEMLEHEDDNVRYLAEARVALKSTLNETRTERLLKLGKNPDDSLRPCPVYYLYYGAHTGRQSGGDKMNFQNFERTNRKNPRKGILRKALLAPFGQMVAAMDSGQIEARVTAWLAGHETLLQAFREKRDVYSETASVIYNRPIDRKNNPADEIPGQVGKVSVLGFGYQQGYETAAQNFLKGVQGAPPITFGPAEVDSTGTDVNRFTRDERKMARVEKMASRLSAEDLVVHCAVTDTIVRKWRKLNEPIVELWGTMEEVLEAMLDEDADYVFGPNECLRVLRHAILLPNGMKLRYPGLKFDPEGGLGGRGGFSYIGKLGKAKVKRHIYGGALTENVVQALARIIVFDQMNHVRAVTGFSPAMMTHDEITIVAPEHYAPRVLHVMRETMQVAPAWCADLPLSVEGGISHSYGLCK